MREAFAELKAATLSNQGQVASRRVTNATHDYYEEVRLLALQASRAELETHVLGKRITVLGIRLRTPAEQLTPMTGRELFAHAVDQGWIGKTTATDEGVGEIVVTGDHARVEVTRAGQPTGGYMHFIKEDGTWRADMMQLIKVTNPWFDRTLKESGLSEDEFTKRILEGISGKVVTEELWTPPAPKEPDSTP